MIFVRIDDDLPVVGEHTDADCGVSTDKNKGRNEHDQQSWIWMYKKSYSKKKLYMSQKASIFNQYCHINPSNFIEFINIFNCQKTL